MGAWPGLAIGADSLPAVEWEFRDEFVGRCFLEDLRQPEDAYGLMLFGYERAVPDEYTPRRYYKKTLGSGVTVLLSFLDESTSGRSGTCTLTASNLNFGEI
jgi:hypothetical protein